MTTNAANVIVASLLDGIKIGLNAKRDEAGPLDGTDWEAESKEILIGLPSRKDFDLTKYLIADKLFSENDVKAAFATMALIPEMDAEGIFYERLADRAVPPFGKATVDAEPDASVVATIAGVVSPASSIEPTTTGEPELTKPSRSSAKTYTIDPNIAVGINAMLTGITKGEVTDIAGLLNENEELKLKLDESMASLTEALTKASRPVIPTTGTTTTGVGELTYEVVQRKAYELFKDNEGKSAKSGMNFDVPTLVWKDSTGAVVDHPEVPAVDTHYDFDLMQVLHFLIALNGGYNTWLFGHTGTGKSTFVEQVASRIGWPVARVNLDSNLERADLVGHTTLHQEAGATVTKFEEGILPRAMQRPGFLLMDEIDAGRPDILFVVQRSLEGNGLMLTEDGGRIIKPHPLFRFAATANTRGAGDEYGMYQGTRVMNGSMIDRFHTFLEFQYMKPDREASLLRKRCPALDAGKATAFASFALECRTAFNKAEVSNTISPRGLTTMAESFVTFVGTGMKEDMALQNAMQITILNKAPNDTVQKFIEIAQRVFSLKIKTKR